MLWYLLAINLFDKTYKNVLDVGCGFGNNIRLIKFKNYTGLDIDKQRINKNKFKHNKKNLTFKFHDITLCSYRSEYNFDLVILIQVLTNSFLDKEKILETIKNIINSGENKIIFNTSKKNIRNLDMIDEYLLNANINFSKIRYGIPSQFRKLRIPIINQFISLLFFIGILLKLNIYNNDKVLYICTKK